MKAQKNTLACIFAFLTASAPLCGTNIVVDSFFTEQAEQSFSSTDEDSGPLGAVFDPGILGGGRSFGRRQFDQVDFGDSTTVSILNGSLNIEIIDTNPSADENNIFVAYGDINELSTPLNLDLNPFKKFGVFRFEFSAIPVGALLDIQLGAKFSVQNYVLNPHSLAKTMDLK